MFENGFAIHDGKSLFKSVFAREDGASAAYGRGNLVLYFEELELDESFERNSPQVQLIHQVRLEPWGQRIFRFFDPDQHVVEIGEPIAQ